jgi:secreted Zn-dependent insulinase-like peptidase
MHKYPSENYVSGSRTLIEYNAVVIQKFLDLLNPENFKIVLVSASEDVEGWAKGKHDYETPYKVSSLSPEFIKSLSVRGSCFLELHLPRRNEFVPESYALVSSVKNGSSIPEIVIDTPLARIWHKQASDDFPVPKAILRLEIKRYFLLVFDA